MAISTLFDTPARSFGRQMRLLIGFVLLSILSGCGGSSPTSNCVPAAGVVLVDSVPAAGVMVSLHPAEGGRSISHGVSQQGGEFVISTYAQGDGAAPGTYKVTCQWGTYDPLARAYTDDRLKGKYSDPTKSDLSWTLSADESSAFQQIELVTTPNR